MNSIGTWIPVIAQAVSSRLLPFWGNGVWRAEGQSSRFHRGQVKQLAPITIPKIEWGGNPSEMWSFKNFDRKGIDRVD